MIAEAISAEHETWSPGAVTSNTFGAIHAPPLAIFCFAIHQSCTNKFFMKCDHDEPVFNRPSFSPLP